MRNLANWFTASLLSLLLLAAAPTHAAVSRVTVTPADGQVALGQATSITLRWTMSSTTQSFVRSSSGTFRIPGGPALGTVNTTLYRTLPRLPIDTNLVPLAISFTETVLVPASVVVKAFKAGVTRIEYVRTFEDADGPPLASTGVFFADISSSSAAGFGITRLALSFEDNSLEKVVDQDQTLRPKAQIAYTGSGVLQAVWEVADSASTAGVPVYRPLLSVRQFVGAGNETTLIGPALPTRLTGLHLVRLRLISPELPFETPVARYFVNRSAGPVPRPIALKAPPHLALLAANTQFAWQPIPDVRAYQLEFYLQPRPAVPPDDLSKLERPTALPPEADLSGAPATGLLVPGTTSTVAISPLARSHLASGRTYMWRVLAIGPDGQVNGESPVRVIRVP